MKLSSRARRERKKWLRWKRNAPPGKIRVFFIPQRNAPPEEKLDASK